MEHFSEGAAACVNLPFFAPIWKAVSQVKVSKIVQAIQKKRTALMA